VQDRFPDWLLTQDVNLPGGAARAERATGHRVQDREFDKPKRVARPQFIKSMSKGHRAVSCGLAKRALGALRGGRASAPTTFSVTKDGLDCAEKPEPLSGPVLWSAEFCSRSPPVGA
jgi:hypothetical protein